MAAATWIDIFGADATVTTVGGKVQITFTAQGLSNGGLGEVASSFTPTTTNAAEKVLAALLVHNSKRTFTEADNNVIFSKFGDVLQTTTRNNLLKWQEDINVSIYSTATGVPTSTDSDNV